MKRFQQLLALLVACVGCSGSGSGVQSSKTLSNATNGEIQLVCSWMTDQLTTEIMACFDDQDKTVNDYLKDCYDDLADARMKSKCMATVGEIETCVQFMIDHACELYSSSSIKTDQISEALQKEYLEKCLPVDGCGLAETESKAPTNR